MTSIKGPTQRRDDEFDLIMYVECGNLEHLFGRNYVKRRRKELLKKKKKK